MTRYSGKLVKASSVKDVYDMRVKRSDTLKYKVYKFVRNSKKPLITTTIHNELMPNSPRRTAEKILTDLTNAGDIKRTRCTCGMGYVYTSIK